MIALGIGVLIFPTIFLIAGIMTGTLEAWLSSTRFVFDVYAAPLSRIRLFWVFFENVRTHFAWLCAVGAGASIFWLTNINTRRHAILLFGMAVTAMVSFAAQNKGFGYHLGGLIPVFTMFALGGVSLAFQTHDGSRPLQYACRTLAVVFSIFLCIGLERRVQNNFLPYARSFLPSTPPSSTDRAEETKQQAIAIITKESDANAYFFQWGWNYDIGFRAERLSASRFLNTPAFSQIAKDNVAYHPWLEMFDRELTEKKPIFILLDLTTIPKETKVDDDGINLPTDVAGTGLAILVAHLNREYTIRFKWKDKILFKRIGMPGTTAKEL
jgi:hypothetical protein